MGSLATIDEIVLTEMACQHSTVTNHSYRWLDQVLFVDSNREFLEKGLIVEMKARGLIVKWAPQKDILAHFAIGGFWSHCGWNSTLESVSECVPMLCQPFDAGQLLNAPYVS